MASRPKYGGDYCAVVGCHKNVKKDKPLGVTFFSFPTRDPEQRRLWIQAVNRKNPDGSLWQPSKYSKICCEHFTGKKWSRTRGHPDFVPSIFPTSHVRGKKESDVKRHERFMKRRQSQKENKEKSEEEEEEDFSPPSLDDTLEGPSCSKNFSVKVQTTSSSMQVREKSTQTKEKKMRSRGVNTDTLRTSPIKNFNDKQVKAFTGVSPAFIEVLQQRLSTKLKDSYKLKKCEKIQLVLVKIKLNISFVALSGMFNLSGGRAGELFSQTLAVMYDNLKDLLCWFSKERIQARMPAAFRGLFPNTRVILDATEIPCEKPSSKKLDIQLYSHYKGRHTLKYLIGIAPSGEITFISKAFGGRATDIELTAKSGILDLIQAGDTVLADKGFPRIETDLAVRGGLLVIPPLASGERQFSTQENRQGFECATVRIHVERAIQRIKMFELFHFVHTHMFPHMDKIAVIVSVICNCFKDLIKE